VSAMPWAALLAAALRLGLSPDAFWRMSLREWRLVHAASAAPAMSRSELEKLDREIGNGRADER
jgi:uncharacterized phage protein (TIGR02216 family)